MPVYTGFDRMKEIAGRMGIKNLRIVRSSGQNLAQQIKDLNPAGAVVVARNANAGLFDGVKDRAFIAAIDDSKAGRDSYIPVFETATFAMMAYAKADPDSLKKFYDMIATEAIDPAKIDEMLKKGFIVILPRAMRFDTDKELRDLYELAQRIYISA